MSRYLLLFLLNIPLVFAGILNATVSYKLGKTSNMKFTFQILIWLIVLAGLLFTHSIYSYLFSHRLTASEPLSLFDVILTTGLTVLTFGSMRTHQRLDSLEHRVQDLHQQLSIKLSDD